MMDCLKQGDATADLVNEIITLNRFGWGGYDLKSPNDEGFAFDYNSSGMLDHIVLYRPGRGAVFIVKNDKGNFSPVYSQGDPGSDQYGNGIGGYNLRSANDRAFAFDYDGTRKLDHIILYRPGRGAVFIVKKNPDGNFSPVYSQGDPGSGIGGYDLRSEHDRAFAFDYNSSGNLDHIVLYRPGKGAIFIVKTDKGNFSPVYSQGDPGPDQYGNGIGGYNLRSANDRAFAFDYDGTRKLDHIILYRPGRGAVFIVKKNPDGNFSPVYNQGDPGSGIGGYDLRSVDDRAFAFDYDGTGKLDHIVLYRPGKGAIFIVKNDKGNFSPVYSQGDPGPGQYGNGIGGYDLRSPNDRAFAFDYDGTGKLDHIVLYRPGKGAVFIVKKNPDGNFSTVYKQGERN
jgi:hypothetical protein